MNLLSIPPFIDGSNFDNDSNDGSEIFSEDLKKVSQKSHLLLKSKRNTFPLKKPRSRSFEHLERELRKAEDPSRGSEDGRKEKREQNVEGGKILQVRRDPPDAGSEESGRDSDTSERR